jgi:multidrug efflux pump subunit AcrA (membrane-fusion protein)
VRATAWRDLAQQDLKRNQQALSEDLERLEKQSTACRVELEVAQEAYQRAKALVYRRAMSEERYQEIEGKQRVWQAHLEQVQAEKRAREAKGTMDAEAELARREKELADAQARLTLLEAGSRPEEIAAEHARLARFQEERAYLTRLESLQSVDCPAGGEVTTPRFKEKIGQYFQEGDLLCVVEQLADLEAEITVSEQDVARIKPGQTVLLRARSLPFDTLRAQLQRIAPVADSGDVQSHVVLHCCLESAPDQLRPGMTGYARVYTGRRTVGEIVLDRTLRLVRTEFWLW